MKTKNKKKQTSLENQENKNLLQRIIGHANLGLRPRNAHSVATMSKSAANTLEPGCVPFILCWVLAPQMTTARAAQSGPVDHATPSGVLNHINGRSLAGLETSAETRQKNGSSAKK